MRKTKKTLVILAIVTMVVTMVPMQAFADTTTGVPTRISGTNQYDTAVEIAKQGWTAGVTKNAVLAYGGSNKACLADALASGPLAAALGAPILLTDGDTLTPSTIQELKDLGVTTVYVTSGTSVIKKTVLDQLTAFTVKPVWGQDAPSTSVEIAKAMATVTGVAPTSVALANGTVGAQDALSVASIASGQKFPIFITDNEANLPKVVKNYLATLFFTKSYVIGGTSVISDDQKLELTGAVRLSGNNAYDTNVAVIKAFSDAKAVKFDHLFVANGMTLFDALSGAPFAAKYNAVIVLTDGVINARASATVNDSLNSSSIVIALGGVNAVPNAAVGINGKTQVENLTNLPVFKGKTLTFNPSGYTDNTGVLRHPAALVGGVHQLVGGYSGTYLLNAKYSRLKGNVSLQDEEKNVSSKEFLNIYGDDKLLYTSAVIEPGVYPQDFDVDVTGVVQLRLEVTNGGNWSDSIILSGLDLFK